MTDTPVNLSLSQREIDVLKRLIEGYTERGVALELGISRRTVSVYTSRIRLKFGVESTMTAVSLAIRFGFLQEKET